jgi:hypothetical protein
VQQRSTASGGRLQVTSDDVDAEIRGEEDHDLLTFDESGIRLRQEIEETRRALAGGLSPEARRLLETRLETLASALVRTSRTATDSPGEQGFLSYRPPTAVQ